MDDKTGALEKLKAIMAKAEQVDMSSVKIGDIIYVPLDEEDGLILKDGYKDRNKYIVIIGFTPEGVAIGALLIKITKKNGKLKGCLISEDRERVMQFLRETEVFDNATKRRYGIIK